MFKDGHIRILNVSRRGGCRGSNRTRTGRGAERNVFGPDSQQDMEPLSALCLSPQRKTCSNTNETHELGIKGFFCLCYCTHDVTACLLQAAVICGCQQKPSRLDCLGALLGNGNTKYAIYGRETVERGAQRLMFQAGIKRVV